MYQEKEINAEEEKTEWLGEETQSFKKIYKGISLNFKGSSWNHK